MLSGLSLLFSLTGEKGTISRKMESRVFGVVYTKNRIAKRKFVKIVLLAANNDVTNSGLQMQYL